MKDIKAILAGHEIPEETAAAIAAEVKANYRTIAEWTKKVDRISELEAQNAELAEAASKVEGTTAEIGALQEQLEAMRKADEQRKAEEAEQTKRDEFRKAFDEALGEREFANAIIRDAVFETTYSSCSADAAVNAKDALEAAVKDVDNVWKNPQRDPHRMPTDEQMKTGRSSAEHQKKSFANALFG